MELVNESVKERHQIECKGDSSYWVLRYPDVGKDEGRVFSRVVFFARSRNDAENYIRRYRRLSD